MEDVAAFARLIDAVRPWLQRLVVVGGWAHRLHRLHELAHPAAHLPIVTRDVDLGFATDASLPGDIRSALRRAGFQEDLLGEHVPPVVHYTLGQAGGFYAEFLTPLHGSDNNRDGSPNATVRKAGITAQKLRYLDLLLVAQWAVRVGPRVNVPVANDVDVLVPNPTSFIVQKLLIHSRRMRLEDKAKDVLYIHDTLELFGGAIDRLAALWFEEVKPAMPAKTARRVSTRAKEIFAEVTDAIREAARIPKDRGLDPEQIRRACEYGLEQILETAQAG